MAPEGELTALVQRWGAGDLCARDRLFESLLPDLRRMAARRLRAERSGHTLQPTALVSELFLRLANGAALQLQDRTHFMAVAAQIMRRVLVEYARRHAASKRAGGRTRVTFDEARLGAPSGELDLLLLDGALDELAEEDANVARAIELRFFGGLTIPEIAVALAISPATVKRHITYAKAWLYARMTRGQASEER